MAAQTNNAPLKVLDHIIVRSPLYPFNFNSGVDDLHQLLEDDFFLEAIYIASPLLYEECVKLKGGEIKTEKERTKVINSLYRYYTRMYTRSTPFGLFSTCDVAEWGSGDNTNVVRDYARHTRLDMQFLQTMISVLSQITYVNELLLYHANNSIYVSGTEIRYIEHTYFNNKRKYKISAVTKNEYILKVLAAANTGISRTDMVALIVKDGVSQTDAEGFIDNLIQSQLLISEFEVAITGEDDFAFQILNHLQAIYDRSGSWYIQSIMNFFRVIVSDLQTLDDNKCNKVAVYKAIIAKLKQLQAAIDEGKTFHIDSYRVGDAPLTIRESAKTEILELIAYLTQLNEGFFVVNNTFEEFKTKFRDRYEHQIVPLAEVLDTDIGIGYPVNRKVSAAPMVDDIPLPHREGGTQIQLNMIEKWLYDLFINPANSDLYSIDLDKQEQHRLFKKPGANSDKWKSVPPSFSVMFRVLNDDPQSLLFETIMGPSASAFLARFTYGNPDMKKLLETIVQEEEQVIENAILAEIVHLPDDRVTNVIMHPPVRKFEIPYLAAPSVGSDCIIELSDLYVKYENNEIVLFSKKLNKRVLPRKTHMHNHGNNSLPLYNFLADLQGEGINSSFGLFGPELLKLFVFFPRLYYKNTIVSPALWSFNEIITAQLRNLDESNDGSFVNELRKRYRIPRRVLHVDGDNDLLVDFDNKASIDIWLNLLKTKSTVLLKEFLYKEDTANSIYSHQFIASVVCTEKKVYAPPIQFEKMDEALAVQRQFLLGSEWLYLKLYCGIGSVDIVLSKIVSPLMKKMMQEGLLHKWFFIKYFDTDYHIRLRLHLKTSTDIHLVLQMLNEWIQQSPDGLLVWKTQPDIYIREIERYGADTIDLCEFLFFVDSLVTVEMPALVPQAQQDKLFFLWSLKMIDDMLSALQLTIGEKIDFVDAIRKGYQYEFNANKDTNEGINKKYNTLKVEMAAIMANEDATAKYKNMSLLLQQKIAMQANAFAEIAKRKQAGDLGVNFYGLVSSLIHMMLNRIITNKERLHEFLAYEFLLKYYRMILFKEKKGEA